MYEREGKHCLIACKFLMPYSELWINLICVH